MGDTIHEVLKGKIPSDSSAQVDAFSIIKLNSAEFENKTEVLDLGAGTGASFDRLRRYIPNLKYTGLDIESSPEVESRTRTDLDIRIYDGKTMPFSNSKFDVVFCKQVLEHVRHPDAVIAEVSRILKPGGIFVGSCSQLEPYHSHSIFNWTAYGIVQVFESHDLFVKQIRPGIDGITLTMRRVIDREKFNNFFGFESLFNHYIDGRWIKSSHEEKNFQKLLIAGHLVWLAQKS
ncbi:class I SAM-dependent methyltransferase [Rhizobium mongolense]|uniref:class I SAM-dependent methyltransferase n=1 Tax=Rhizobium mongolense TaxID=57676 RepID=UPI003557D009